MGIFGEKEHLKRYPKNNRYANRNRYNKAMNVFLALNQLDHI